MTTVQKTDLLGAVIYEGVQHLSGKKTTLQKVAETSAVNVASSVATKSLQVPHTIPGLTNSETILVGAVVGKSFLMDNKDTKSAVLNGLIALGASRGAHYVLESMGMDNHIF